MLNRETITELPCLGVEHPATFQYRQYYHKCGQHSLKIDHYKVVIKVIQCWLGQHQVKTACI